MAAAAAAATVAVAGFVGFQFLGDADAPAPNVPAPMDLAAPPEQSVAEADIAVAEPTAEADIAVAEPAAEVVDASEPAPEPVSTTPIAPSFDLVRVDAAGGAVIAGRAAANADLRLRLDGQEIHMASSDGTGSFVAMLLIPPSDLPQVLSLEMIMAGGGVLMSDQSVIIQPATSLAAATPAPDASPDLPEIDTDLPALASTTDPALASATPEAPQLDTPTSPATPADGTPVELADANLPDAPDLDPATDIALETATAPAGEDAVPPVTELAMLETQEPDGPATDRAPAESAAATSEPAAAVTVLDTDIADPEMPETIASEQGAVEPASTDAAAPQVSVAIGITETASETAVLDPGPIVETITAPATTGETTAPEPSDPVQTTIPTAVPGVADGTPETAVVAEATTAPALPVTTTTPVVPDLPQAPDASGAQGPSETTETTEPQAPPVSIAEGTTETTEPQTTTVVIAEGTTETTEPHTPAVTIAEGTTETTEPQAPAIAIAEGTTETAEPQAPAVEIAEGTTEATEPQTPTVAIAEETTEATEPQAPTVMIADSQGIRVVQAGGPEPQVQVVLDTIAYDAAGEVVLTGRGPAQSDVRLYLDNQPVQLAQIDAAGGWSTQLPQVDPGTYTLRVDEVSEAGAVLSRVETPFLREEPAVLAALPQRVGVSVITVQPGHTLWGIARDQLGAGVLYVQVYEANRDLIRDPHWIYPGQIFAIPDVLREQ
jgi:nucleoid-associated protein YgaU